MNKFCRTHRVIVNDDVLHTWHVLNELWIFILITKQGKVAVKGLMCSLALLWHLFHNDVCKYTCYIKINLWVSQKYILSIKPQKRKKKIK